MLACADESNEVTMTSLDLASRAKKYEDDMDDTGLWIGKVIMNKHITTPVIINFVLSFLHVL